MAYQERFYHIYCDTYGKQFRISLQEWEYVGTSQQVDAGPEPIVFEQQNSAALKKGGVFPSAATITFVSTPTFRMGDIYTADNKKFLIEHYRTDGSSEGRWIGNIIPNGFSEQYDGEFRYLVFMASDNLPLLQTILFVQENGDNYGLDTGEFQQTFIWALTEGLRKTGFGLELWTMVDIKALSNEATSYTVTIAGNSEEDFFNILLGSNQGVASDIVARLNAEPTLIVDSPSGTGTYTVTSVTQTTSYPFPINIRVEVAEAVPDFPGEGGTITIPEQATGLVLARQGHFNDVAPSEIGIFKEGVDFSFLKIGDTVKISESTNNDGTYEVTGFVNSVPPDDPYIRIQLSPQVPEQVHENVVIEIITQRTDYPDPLATTVHDTRTWINDANLEGVTYYEQRGSAMNTWEVLDAIARQYNLKIYQINGHWAAKRVNADILPTGVYQWFKYNPAGEFIGREDFGQDVTVACEDLTTTRDYQLYGAVISMDRVLRRSIVNYRYKYKTDGDSLINLIKGGNFIPPLLPIGSSVDPATYTPIQWGRRSQVSTIPPMFILPSNSWPLPPYVGPPGILSFIRMNGIYHDRQWLTTYSGYPTDVTAGDSLRISWWQRVNGQMNAGGTWIYARSVIRILISTDAGEALYMLVNGGTSQGQDTEPCQWVPYNMDAKYYAYTSQNPGTITSSQPFPPAPGVDGLSPWGEVRLSTPPCPASGNLIFEIVGSGMGTLLPGEPNRLPNTVPIYAPTGQGAFAPRAWNLATSEIWFTGFFAAKVIDPSSEGVPLIHGYMYPEDDVQRTRNYTDTIEDIEVLTGDDGSPDHVSNIYVREGNALRVVKQWDSWRSDFGWGALGLILAKSIMQQYWTPWRIIEGVWSLENVNWDTRLHFDDPDLEGMRFIILSGRIDPKGNKFSGIIAQIWDESFPGLPSGGNDGGQSSGPQWENTGVWRCVRATGTGLNTGEVEILQSDTNPASATFGQERWIISGEDTDSCPIGQPPAIFYGEQETLNPASLRSYPVDKSGDSYTVYYSNNDGPNLLRLLHLASLGTVQEIQYEGGYVSASGWVYGSDETVGGYTYKSLYLTWVTGTYTQVPVTFTIS